MVKKTKAKISPVALRSLGRLLRKPLFDELHLRKIDLSDEVYVINVGGYVGESTRNELAYAKRIGRAIRYMEC